MTPSRQNCAGQRTFDRRKQDGACGIGMEQQVIRTDSSEEFYNFIKLIEPLLDHMSLNDVIAVWLEYCSVLY